MADRLRALFRRVAALEGWDHKGDLEDAPTPYDPFSTYFALQRGGDHNGALLGGLWLVRGNPGGLLPTLAVWPELGGAGFGVRTDVADAYLLALAPEARGRSDGACPLFWLLGVALWRWCTTERVSTLCGIATPRNAALYRRLGWPLEVAGPERPHWGERCVPWTMGVQEVAGEVARRAGKGAAAYRAVLRAAAVVPAP